MLWPCYIACFDQIEDLRLDKKNETEDQTVFVLVISTLLKFPN